MQPGLHGIPHLREIHNLAHIGRRLEVEILEHVPLTGQISSGGGVDLTSHRHLAVGALVCRVRKGVEVQRLRVWVAVGDARVQRAAAGRVVAAEVAGGRGQGEGCGAGGGFAGEVEVFEDGAGGGRDEVEVAAVEGGLAGVFGDEVEC